MQLSIRVGSTSPTLKGPSRTGLRPHARARRTGFTLIEAILTLAVMASVVTLAAMMPRYYLQVRHGRHVEQAVQLAHQELEAWREVGYSSLPAIPNASTSTTQTSLLTSLSSLPNATGQVVVTRVDSTLSPVTVPAGNSDTTTRRKVVVTVSWTGLHYDNGSQTVTSIISK